VTRARIQLLPEAVEDLRRLDGAARKIVAAGIEKLRTDPELRGRGYARRALSDLCRLLLESTPSVCLFVRAENERAIGLYESIGMKQVGLFRSIVL